jgi:putative SOS response-associated peptidase YedK
MCGRYTSTSDPSALAEAFGVEVIKAEPLPLRYNVAPTQPVYAVAERRPRDGDQRPERQLGAFRWGLIPSWAKDPSIGSRLINARAETVATKPAYREALVRRRCLIPADSFYEWQMADSGPRQPYAIRHADGSPLAFAGLWEVWRPPTGDEPWRTCVIITTSANAALAPIHHRMPVILPPESWDRWLDPGNHDLDALCRLLVSAPSEAFEAYPVSKLVNSVANDSPELVRPLSEGQGAEVLDDGGVAEHLQFG